MKKPLTALLLSFSLVAHGLTGIVSKYSRKFTGKKTADGSTYNPHKHTAAHRTLPFGTCLKILNKAGLATWVTVNDRGPWIRGRVLDISDAAAQDLELTGLQKVEYEVVPKEECK